MSQRLISARNAAKLSQSDVADRLLISRNAVSQWENGSNSPKSARLPELAKLYGVSFEWLATGRGEMHMTGIPDRGALVPAISVTVPEISLRDDSQIIRSTYSFPAEGFRQIFGTEAEHARIMEVAGDNMEPTLYHGQKIMIDVEDRKPSPPGIFALWDGAGIVFNRIEHVGEQAALVLIRSDNPRYLPRECPAVDLKLKGRVIGAWMRL